jgi:hypothetical protein
METNRQVAENIMETLGLEKLIDSLEQASISNGFDMLTTLSLVTAEGIGAELFRFEANLSKERKERSKEKKEIIYNNNNKNKNSIDLSKLNTGARSIPPLVAKAEAKARAKKVDRRVQMPKAWVDARQKETIDLGGNLVSYAESQGYDWYGAKEMFLAFVDYHLAKGSIFKSWDAAWRTWIRNDIKFNGKPAAKKPGSMIQSYQHRDPMGELFHD